MMREGVETFGYNSWEELWADYTVFTMVRNPYDRAGSSYDYIVGRHTVRCSCVCSSYDCIVGRHAARCSCFLNCIVGRHTARCSCVCLLAGRMTASSAATRYAACHLHHLSLCSRCKGTCSACLSAEKVSLCRCTGTLAPRMFGKLLLNNAVSVDRAQRQKGPDRLLTELFSRYFLPATLDRCGGVQKQDSHNEQI